MTEDEKEMLSNGRVMVDLVETRAWQSYKNITNAQIELRKELLCVPASESGESELKAEFMKGYIAGLRLAIETPEHMIADMKATAETYGVEGQI